VPGRAAPAVSPAGPIVWVTYTRERLGMPTLIRRPVRVGPFAIACLAAAVLAALAGCGTNTRTIIKEPGPRVTITVTATPRTIVKTVSGAPSITCQGSAATGQVQPGILVAGLPDDTTCTVKVVSPEGGSHLGEIQITTPGGQWSDYNMVLTGSG
jgi:hypothetical protein